MTDGFGARLALLAVVGVLLFGFQAEANVVSIVRDTYGVDLSNGGDYDWWYGCSPTSAGMMMGYYDRNGYGGLGYSNLVPGGVAEPETFVGPPTGWAALANNAIASSRHVSDYYSGGYGASGDDVAGAPTGPLNCLADFMGTSQDSYLGYTLNNSNGATTWWYWSDGSKYTSADVYAGGPAKYHDSGMYGILEYVQYSGYDTTQLYNQRTDNMGLTYGFSFDDYKAEIDAGRVVLIHVTGHTMLGYGYNDTGNQVTLYDTWDPGPHYMTWGDAYVNPYYDPLGMRGVTVLELTGGEVVPEPTMLVGLASMIPAGLFLWRRRRRK